MVSYFRKTVAASIFLLLTLLAGCGDFEWFPKDNIFSNNSTASTPATKPGKVMRALPYPDTVKWVSDVAYDQGSNSFWLLAGTTGDVNNPAINPAVNVLVQISALDGSLIEKIEPNLSYPWPDNVIYGSTLANDGTYFWITSSGTSGGLPISEVYQLTSVGLYFNGKKYNCPATSNGSCQGLAFDQANLFFWTVGSDNTSLVSYYLVDLNVLPNPLLTYSNSLFANASDVAFDAATNEVFVVKNGIVRVNSSSGAYLGSIPFTLPGAGRGDWDGTYFWVVDNSSKSIKALFVR